MLEELESKLNEAHQTLIALNEEYNDLLTVEHEEAMKKRASKVSGNLSWDDVIREVNRTPENPAEKTALARADLFYSIRMFIFLALAFSRTISFFLAFPLVTLNAIYTGIKKIKIRDKYENNNESKKESNVSKKEPARRYSKAEKEELYEKVCDARFNYHTLRKEYERKKGNLDLENKAKDSQEDDNREALWQLYAAYIDYVKNPQLGEENIVRDNNVKLYELRPSDEK